MMLNISDYIKTVVTAIHAYVYCTKLIMQMTTTNRANGWTKWNAEMLA